MTHFTDYWRGWRPFYTYTGDPRFPAIQQAGSPAAYYEERQCTT